MKREQSMERLLIGNYKVDVIDNPKQTLTKKELDDLVQACIPVARKGFGNEGVTESDIYTHAVEVNTGIYIRNEQGELIGFGGSSLEEVGEKSVVHLKGAAILPEYQGKGLYSILTPLRAIREAEKNGPEVYIGTRTQNPRVFEYMSNRLGFYPKVDETPEKNLEKIAETYATLVNEKHSDFRSKGGVGFNKESFVVKRAYGFVNEEGEEQGFCMYGENMPQAKDSRIDNYLQKNLDFSNGDAMILVGKFDEKTYMKAYEAGINQLQEKNERISA